MSSSASGRLVRQFTRLVAAGQAPSVEEFLSEAGAPPVAELAELLLVDMSRLWQLGRCIPLEHYLSRWPQLAENDDALLDLACRELVLRLGREEAPCPDDYAQRFPRHAQRLRCQLQLTLAVREAVLEGAGQCQADGGGPEDDPPAGPGDDAPVPGYEILEELGRGGCGVVYRARELKLNRVVALKMIRAGAYADRAERERFLGEARAVARLNHPNIVPVFHVGECDGLPFFSQEFCGGGSLADRLAKAPLPAEEGARVTEHLARAVQHAHEQGIVHRDLKPANVLLAIDGTPKVADFGLAKVLNEQGLTATGDIPGTAPYMAPEQAAGRKDAGPPMDVWSLGAILYECLTGRPPFRAATTHETLRQVMSEDPVPPRRIQPRLPRDLETICLKCLHKDPARRYASALELAEDLRRWRAGDPIRARPIGCLERLVKCIRRRPAVAALAALLVVGTVVVLWLEHSRAEEATALRREAQTSEQEARDHKRKAQEGQLAARHQASISSSGLGNGLCEKGDIAHGILHFAQSLRLAPSSASDLRSAVRTNLATWSLELPRLHDVHPGTAELLAAAFSPDGKHFLVGGADGTASLWDASAGKRRHVFRGHAGKVKAVAFSRDGRRAVTGSEDHTARVWDVVTGQELLVLKEHETWVFAVAFAPDNTVLTASRTIRLWDPETGREKSRFGPAQRETYTAAFGPDGKCLLTTHSDKTIRVWDPGSGKELRRLGEDPSQRHLDHVFAVAFSPGGKTVATGSPDWTVRVWDLATGQVRVLRHRDRIDCIAYVSENVLLTGCWDGRVLAWDLAASPERLAAPPLFHDGQLYALAVSPDGLTIVTGGQDKILRVWKRSARKAHTRWRVETTQPVTAMALSKQGDRLFACDDGKLRLFDAQTGCERWNVPRGCTYRKAAFSPEGRTLALAGQKSACLLDPHTGVELGVVRPHEKPLLAVAAGPGAATVLTGSADKTVRLSDVLTGETIATFRGRHNGQVAAVALSPDGGAVLTGGYDGVGQLWDARTGEPLGPSFRHPGGVHVVAWSEDGEVVLTGGWAETRLWKRSGKALGIPMPHPAPATAARLSPDGRVVVTGHGDGTARLWDVATGRPLAAPFRHASKVLAVGFGRDGRIVTGTEGGVVSHWEVPGAVEGDPERVALWAEVITGMELDPGTNAPQFLGPDDWLARRRRLQEWGGPPLVPTGR